MAGSDDDETVQGGSNQERRLCGLAGDDDEDDMREDAAELFGRVAQPPIILEPCDDQAVDGDGEENNGKRSRPSTSAVWLDFKKIFKMVNGKKVRYGAKCIHCSKEYSGRSSGGTGHLTRHRDRCPRRREKTHMSQSQISFNPDGSIRNWEYCPIVARTQLVRLLARLDVPVSLGESYAFEDYIRTAHNPKFVSVSRQTTTRDLLKYFNDCKAKLVEIVKSAGVNCVCLTSDIWSGNAKEDYLSVVAHYINSDWQLEKRVLGLRLIDCSHNGQNIADRVASVLDDYCLTEKVFAVTLDNASSNVSAMQKLRPVLSKYLGIEVVDDDRDDNAHSINSLFLHQRCACHIINLIVKEALTALKPLIEKFRIAISFLNSSN